MIIVPLLGKLAALATGIVVVAGRLSMPDESVVDPNVAELTAAAELCAAAVVPLTPRFAVLDTVKELPAIDA